MALLCVAEKWDGREREGGKRKEVRNAGGCKKPELQVEKSPPPPNETENGIEISCEVHTFLTTQVECLHRHTPLSIVSPFFQEDTRLCTLKWIFSRKRKAQKRAWLLAPRKKHFLDQSHRWLSGSGYKNNCYEGKRAFSLRVALVFHFLGK